MVSPEALIGFAGVAIAGVVAYKMSTQQIGGITSAPVVDITMPEITMPEITMPEITLPKIEMPEMPDVSTVLAPIAAKIPDPAALAAYVDERVSSAASYVSDQVSGVREYVDERASDAVTYVDERAGEFKDYVDEKVEDFGEVVDNIVTTVEELPAKVSEAAMETFVVNPLAGAGEVLSSPLRTIGLLPEPEQVTRLGSFSFFPFVPLIDKIIQAQAAAMPSTAAPEFDIFDPFKSFRW